MAEGTDGLDDHHVSMIMVQRYTLIFIGHGFIFWILQATLDEADK